MIQSINNNITEIHNKIRTEQRRLHLHERCLETLKLEKRILKLSENLIKKKIRNRNEFTNFYFLFEHILDNSEYGKENEQQELLISELNFRASKDIVPFLSQRLLGFKKGLDRLSTLISSQKKLVIKLAKISSNSSVPKAYTLVNYILKIGDLTADMEELVSAIILGEEVKKTLTLIVRQLQKTENWGVKEENEDSQDSINAINEVFKHVVTCEMFICSFKNELREFSAGRDLNFHYDSLADFKSSFFNFLILDWVNEKKIKLSLNYSRKVLNSLGAIMKGLEVKKGRIENEISVTSTEKDAITANFAKELNVN